MSLPKFLGLDDITSKKPFERVPSFWTQPIRYCRYAAHTSPALFFSVVLGSMGPVLLLVVPPIRRALGDHDAPRIPLTYPIPSGPRKKLEGYEDE